MEIAGVFLTSWSTVIFAWLWVAALCRANRIERELKLHIVAMKFASSLHHPQYFLRSWLAGNHERTREFYPDFYRSLDDEAGA